jgi:hypothetical protein
VNTTSLYSTIISGRGITSDEQFAEQAMKSVSEFLNADGLAPASRLFLAAAGNGVQFSKPLNFSIITSLNNLIPRAKCWLIEEGISPRETALYLNDIPFKSLDYRQPREVLMEQSSHGDRDSKF